MDSSDAETAPTISLSRGCRSGGFQGALGTHAGLRHPNGQSRTPVAERVSGGGEPDPERSDQGSLAAFRRRKGRWPRSLTDWVERLWRTWRQPPGLIRFWAGIGSSSQTSLTDRGFTDESVERELMGKQNGWLCKWRKRIRAGATIAL